MLMLMLWDCTLEEAGAAVESDMAPRSQSTNRLATTTLLSDRDCCRTRKLTAQACIVLSSTGCQRSTQPLPLLVRPSFFICSSTFVMASSSSCTFFLCFLTVAEQHAFVCVSSFASCIPLPAMRPCQVIDQGDHVQEAFRIRYLDGMRSFASNSVTHAQDANAFRYGVHTHITQATFKLHVASLALAHVSTTYGSWTSFHGLTKE